MTKSETISKNTPNINLKNNESRKKLKSKKLAIIYILIVSIIISTIIGIGIYTFIFSRNSNVKFKTIDGGTIELEDHRGKVIILYFFKLSCKYCKDTDPKLADIDDDYSRTELFIITITTDPADNHSKLNEWRNKHNPKWDIVQDDTSNSITSRYDVSYTPTAIVLDKNGNESEKIVGSEGFDHKVRSRIELLL